MRISRAPEKRGGINKLVLYLLLIITAVITAILITYFVTGYESRSATGDQSGLPDLASNIEPPQVIPDPAPEDTSSTELEMTLLESEPLPPPRFIPDVQFGEVLSEGLIDVELPGEVSSQSWYSFQVDTTTRDITLFFALYGDSPSTITRTVKIEGYTQRGHVDNAEVTLYYPEGPERRILFDGANGTVTLTQQYAQPYGPSMFSPELRVAMVNQRMVLTDESGSIRAQLQLDLSGLSDSEQIIFERSAPDLVDDALAEIQDLVYQIEDKRIK